MVPNMVLVGEAATAEEAIIQTAARQPDMVLMDINMPDLNGIAATRRILEANSSTAVVVLTMYVDDSVFAAVRAGARGDSRPNRPRRPAGSPVAKMGPYTSASRTVPYPRRRNGRISIVGAFDMSWGAASRSNAQLFVWDGDARSSSAARASSSFRANRQRLLAECRSATQSVEACSRRLSRTEQRHQRRERAQEAKGGHARHGLFSGQSNNAGGHLI